MVIELEQSLYIIIDLFVYYKLSINWVSWAVLEQFYMIGILEIACFSDKGLFSFIFLKKKHGYVISKTVNFVYEMLK